MREVNYDLLPEHMREGTRRYVEQGIITGRFLTAVMSNDLMGAYMAADGINLQSMLKWADWLYNEAPAACRGSKVKVNDWSAAGGLKGMEDRRVASNDDGS